MHFRFTRDVGGYSFLYADIFMSEDEFEQMFDLELYRQVTQLTKAKYYIQFLGAPKVQGGRRFSEVVRQGQTRIGRNLNRKPICRIK